MKDNSFRDYVLEQLAGVAHVHARAMFGGVGLYAGDVFFGLIATGALYFKVDESTRADYERAGMKPFKPYADKPMTMSYYQVPVGVLEDADTVAEWARAAIRVGKTSREKPRRRKRMNP